MKLTLDQIKTDESVWPEGATHYIERDFQKWVGEKEFFWKHGSREWLAVNKSWSPEEYAQRGYKIITRPTKPEWAPKVGEWCLSFGGAKVFYVGLDYDDKHIFMLEQRGLTRYETLEGFEALKTERELLIEIIEASGNMSNGILADNILNAGFVFMEPTK